MDNTRQNTPFPDAYETSDPILVVLHGEATKIQSVIEMPVDLDNPGTLMERLNEVDVYLARLGDMHVRAKALKEMVKNRYLDEHDAELSKMSATVSKRKIDAHLFEYTIAVDRLEIMYDSISKISKSLMTRISFIKQQMGMG